MNIPQGLYEVITSKNITLEQKLEAIPRFAWPVVHLDGEHEGMTEPGAITEEDALLICEALRNGNISEVVGETDK